MRRARHDLFLKRLYRAGLRDALRLFFSDLADAIDWDGFRWRDKEIVLPGPRPRSLVADLVGEAPDRSGSPLRLFIHPELQSRLDPEMGWRVLQYEAGFILQQADPNFRILPFVFYHCTGAGGIRRQSFALDFEEYPLLQVMYWSVGLGELEAEAYSEIDNPMAWALAAWMRPPRAGPAGLKLRLVERILGRVSPGGYQDVLFDAVQTYYPLDERGREEERRLLDAAEYHEVDEMLNTYLGRLEQRAHRKGREEGREEGRQQALLVVMRSRFGELSPDIEVGVRRITDPRRLDALIEESVSAASIEEIRRMLDE